ncbi:MAG: ornithine cyclodeaminase family protein [Trueperaceae bacterium]|nr:ornithine cyclodeaminase family protein [Trueperaceae bacterium]
MTSHLIEPLESERIVHVTGEQVRQLLDMSTCIDLMRAALVSLGTGKAHQMVRPVLPLDGRNVLGMMPAYDQSAQVAGAKVLSVFPDNSEHGRASHQGVIVLFDTVTGALKAVVDAEQVTAIRTAAASAAATDALARPDASRLAILGSGVQAWQHLSAIAQVRELRYVTVWSRNTAKAEAFATRALVENGIGVTVCDTVHAATSDADIICTVTSSVEPILKARDVKPGSHINAVGSCTPDARELSSDLVAAGELYVDWAPAALKEAGDLLLAIKEGAVTSHHVVGEVGKVIAGTLSGRARADSVTIYESLGQAVQDLLAANYVVDALTRGDRS